MKFAIVNGSRTEASPRMKGTCSICERPMNSKCGKYVEWHWAHIRNEGCDPWWENETQWHRDWKNHFPAECQEVTLTNSATGVRHRADVKTIDSFVLEFQNSPISMEEIDSREEFYGNLIWIINCYWGGNPELGYFMAFTSTGYTIVNYEERIIEFRWFGRGKLMLRWSLAKKSVIFDFGGRGLWRLVSFDKDSKRVQLAEVDKADFIACHGGIASLVKV